MARHNRNSRNRATAPGWVWMLFGLALGLVVAVGVYFQRVPAGAPTNARDTSARPAPVAAARSPRQNDRTKTADVRDPDEPQFDFYEILPQYEVVVPEVETAASPAARSKPVDEPGSYVLQAGSFSAMDDADRLRASLALLGIESRIQRVTIDDDTFHRVRIGPISDLDKLNRVRKQLRDAHIDAMLMKVP